MWVGFFSILATKLFNLAAFDLMQRCVRTTTLFFAQTVWVNALKEIFSEYLWTISFMYWSVRILAFKMYMHRKGACLHICFSLLSIVITKENMLTICFHAFIMTVYSSSSIYFSLWHFHVLVILSFCISTFVKCLRQPYSDTVKCVEIFKENGKIHQPVKCDCLKWQNIYK